MALGEATRPFLFAFYGIALALWAAAGGFAGLGKPFLIGVILNALTGWWRSRATTKPPLAKASATQLHGESGAREKGHPTPPAAPSEEGGE